MVFGVAAFPPDTISILASWGLLDLDCGTVGVESPGVAACDPYLLPPTPPPPPRPLLSSQWPLEPPMKIYINKKPIDLWRLQHKAMLQKILPTALLPLHLSPSWQRQNVTYRTWAYSSRKHNHRWNPVYEIAS